MAMSNESQGAESVLRVGRITVGALAVGLTTFLVIAGVVGAANRKPGADLWTLQQPLDLMALGWAGVAVVLAFVLPDAMIKNQRKTLVRNQPGPTMDDAGVARMLFTTRTIVGAALLEGAAFFNGIAHLIGGHAWPLVAAVGLLLVLILTKFPTRSRFEAFVEDQTDQIRQDRQSSANSGF